MVVCDECKASETYARLRFILEMPGRNRELGPYEIQVDLCEECARKLLPKLNTESNIAAIRAFSHLFAQS